MSTLRELFKLDQNAEWLIEAVNEHLEKSQQEFRFTPGWFYPSELSHPCDAYLAFKLIGVEPTNKKPHKARTLRIFDLGTARDHDWKRYLRDAGLSIFPDPEPELRECFMCGSVSDPYRHVCIPAYRIRGELDDVVRHPATKEKFVVEIKTKNPTLFSKLERPDNAHILQVHPYMFATGIHKTIILYENKATQEVKTFVVPFNKAIWGQITDRIEHIINLVRHRHTPTRYPIQNDRDCPFYEVCLSYDFVNRKEEGLV